MPTFDIVSQIDMQEVRNAVDQAQRELATRFDFKGTDSTIELHDMELRLHSATEDRLRAVVQVLEEKLVRRKVSLKALEYGKVEEATKGTARQNVALKAGLSSDNARAINRWIKESSGLKGVNSQTQGEQVRVTGKKRDDLQTLISKLREEDFGLPLQFENFRE
jgi:cyclic-di-GMP-binding protein